MRHTIISRLNAQQLIKKILNFYHYVSGKVTYAIQASSAKPRVPWAETKQWSFNYTFADNDPNLGSKIGFLIDTPVKKEFLNMSFDNLKIEISPAQS